MSKYATGSRLGHYEILGKIGEGGMGTVYAARDTKLGRDVALKVLPPELADNAERRRRFEREARSAAALNHPNIVTLYSVEEHDCTVLITMELVDGEPLAARIVEGGLAPEELLRIAVPLADAVATAHEHGIVHRDLKPQNVMIARGDVVKVLDFGLAKPVDTEEELASEETATSAPTTGEGRILGTPAYMSPEQAEGKPVDHRTDIFSLGVVLYEMATGRRPFEGDTAMSVISSVLRHDPPRVAELRAELPTRLSQIVERCLVKDRRRRYQSARDLASDLEQLRADPTVSTSVSAGTSVPAGSAARRKVIWAMTTIAVLGSCGGAGALAHRSLAASAVSTNPSAAVMPARRGPPVRRFQRMTTEYGPELFPQIAPDGSWFVYAASVGRQFDIFRQRVGGQSRTNLTASSPKDDSEPAISPDGERIAFRSERDGGGIYVMGATGESVRRVTDMGHHPAWSPDGKLLSVSSVVVLNPKDRGALGEAWIVDVESGEKRRLEAVTDAVHSTWSADGRRLVFYGYYANNERGLFTVPREGGKPEILPQAKAGFTPWIDPSSGYLYHSSFASGDVNIWRLGLDATTGLPEGEPERVTAGVSADAAWPSLSRDGKHLAFSTFAASTNIAKIRFDSRRGVVEGEPVMLTRGTNAYMWPDVSPDGLWVTFMAGSPDENIFIMRADGSELRALTGDVGKMSRLPRWTAEGRAIVFYSNRSGNSEVWSVAPDGSGLRQISDTRQGTYFAIPAREGTRVVAKVRGMRLLDFDFSKPFAQQAPKRHAPGPTGGKEFWPTDWSPDGKRLAGFVGDPFRVYTFTLETQKYEEITDTGAAPRWLSDGKRLVFWTFAGLSSALAIVDVAEKKQKPLLALTSDNIGAHIALSPDERWIYFSRETHDGDVWLAELEPQPQLQTP